MPNALEIRRRYIMQTRRVEQVIDAAGGNFSDNGADEHINYGLRYLAHYLPCPGRDEVYETDIVSSQTHLEVPRLRFARRVRIYDAATGEWTYLVHKDLHDLLELFPQIGPERGKPYYWARDETGNRISESDTGTNLPIEDPIFINDPNTPLSVITDNPDRWHFFAEEEWTIADGEASYEDVTQTPQDIDAGMFYYFSEPVVVGDYIEISYRDVSHPFVVDLRNADISTVVAGIVPAGTQTVRFSVPYGSMQLLVLRVGDPGRSGTIVSVTRNGHAASPLRSTPKILTLPPADKTYGVQVYGGYTFPEITSDTDSNYWTDNYPELVVDCAAASVEGRLHRNEEGEDAKLQRVHRAIQRILDDRNYEEAYGPDLDMQEILL